MELRDALIVERFRTAISRQDAMVRSARAAVTSYVIAVLLISLAAATLAVGREPLDLDRRTMPDVFGLLAELVVLLGLLAMVQIIACLLRQQRAHAAQVAIDAETPARRRGWWLPEAAYLLLVIVSVIAVWNTFADLGEAALRGL